MTWTLVKLLALLAVVIIKLSKWLSRLYNTDQSYIMFYTHETVCTKELFFVFVEYIGVHLSRK